jgi:hypothetical protein
LPSFYSHRGDRDGGASTAKDQSFRRAAARRDCPIPDDRLE